MMDRKQFLAGGLAALALTAVPVASKAEPERVLVGVPHKTTGLSYTTLSFDAETRDLDWSSGVMAPDWDDPAVEIMGAALTWSTWSGEDDENPSVYEMGTASSRDQVLPAARRAIGGWTSSDSLFWNYILNEQWGRHGLRVYYTTVVPALD